jgi:hypothetical protein
VKLVTISVITITSLVLFGFMLVSAILSIFRATDDLSGKVLMTNYDRVLDYILSYLQYSEVSIASNALLLQKEWFPHEDFSSARDTAWERINMLKPNISYVRYSWRHNHTNPLHFDTIGYYYDSERDFFSIEYAWQGIGNSSEVVIQPVVNLQTGEPDYASVPVMKWEQAQDSHSKAYQKMLDEKRDFWGEKSERIINIINGTLVAEHFIDYRVRLFEHGDPVGMAVIARSDSQIQTFLSQIVITPNSVVYIM